MPTKCPGDPPIGNYGSGHRILLSQNQNRKVSVSVGYSCLKGFAGSFTRALVVLVHALLSMLVLSVQVGRNILHTAVIFVPPVSLPIFNPSVSNQQPCPELPTPVLIERMLPLLCDYDVHVVSLLHNGFILGFPLNFLVNVFLFVPKILHLLMNTLR